MKVEVLDREHAPNDGAPYSGGVRVETDLCRIVIDHVDGQGTWVEVSDHRGNREKVCVYADGFFGLSSALSSAESSLVPEVSS